MPPNPSTGPIATLLIRLWQNPSLHGMAGAFVLKGLGTILSFALIMLAARLLSPADFGTYSILFSASGLLCILACCGQQILLMRSWNEYLAAGDPASLKGALRFAAAALVLGCTVVGLAFYLWLTSRYLPWLTLAVLAYATATAMMLTSMHLVRTAIGVGAGDGLANILAISPPIAYLLACLALGIAADTGMIFLCFAAGSGVTALIHVALMWMRIRTLLPQFNRVRPRHHLGTWSDRSFKLCLSSGLEASNQYVDVLVLAYLMNPTIAGAYFVITRLANAFAVASDAVNMFATRHIPDLYYRGDKPALDRLLYSVALVALAIICAGLLVTTLAGQMGLSVFNADYAVYFPALIILCIGTASIAAVGPASFILMFTGHEGGYLRIIGASVALRALLFFVLVPQFGIMGAAAATAASLIAMAILLRHSTQSMSGIDSSVLNLLPRIGKFAPAR